MYFLPSKETFFHFAHDFNVVTTPYPVARSLPSSPPEPTGLPVTTCEYFERSEGSFVCHKVRESSNEDECAGRLLFASKTAKSFRNEDLEERRILLKSINSLDNILGFDFKNHHSVDDE
jgi:hypothetical protein